MTLPLLVALLALALCFGLGWLTAEEGDSSAWFAGLGEYISCAGTVILLAVGAPALWLGAAAISVSRWWTVVPVAGLLGVALGYGAYTARKQRRRARERQAAGPPHATPHRPPAEPAAAGPRVESLDELIALDGPYQALERAMESRDPKLVPGLIEFLDAVLQPTVADSHRKHLRAQEVLVALTGHANAPVFHLPTGEPGHNAAAYWRAWWREHEAEARQTGGAGESPYAQWRRQNDVEWHWFWLAATPDDLVPATEAALRDSWTALAVDTIALPADHAAKWPQLDKALERDALDRRLDAVAYALRHPAAEFVPALIALAGDARIERSERAFLQAQEALVRLTGAADAAYCPEASPKRVSAVVGLWQAWLDRGGALATETEGAAAVERWRARGEEQERRRARWMALGRGASVLITLPIRLLMAPVLLIMALLIWLSATAGVARGAVTRATRTMRGRR